MKAFSTSKYITISAKTKKGGYMKFEKVDITAEQIHSIHQAIFALESKQLSSVDTCIFHLKELLETASKAKIIHEGNYEY